MNTDDGAGNKPKILIICNYYLPGFKSGGSLRTIVNTVERLQDKFEFSIITLGHDGDNVQYETVKIDEWNETENAKVFYLSKKESTFSKLRELITKAAPQIIYINSFFATLSIYTLLLRRLALIPKNTVILAPEGELADSALKLKPAKKKAFLRAAKILDLHRNLIWKTTSDTEKSEAEKIKGGGGQIFIAPNLPAKDFSFDYRQNSKLVKKTGEAKMIFLSRYMKIKNFNWLLKLLTKVEGSLIIDVYGTIEDKNYWREGLEIIKKLPPNIAIKYCGAVRHEEVVKTMFEYQFFILPTTGENFGHVLIEALAAGCPVITSDRTPWRKLEAKKIGWDIPLENPQKWIDIINECIRLDDKSYSNLSGNARTFAAEWLNDPKIEESTLRVLEAGLSNGLTKPC